MTNPDSPLPPATEPLLSYVEALELVLTHVKPLPPETVTLDNALGAYLAESARARSHSPSFEQSSMDGFAVRMEDVMDATPDNPVTLIIADELPAGDSRRLQLKPGQTIKVFTGSQLPGGAEAVVVREQVTETDDQAAVAAKVTAGDHIRRVGEEYRRGDEILPVGTHVSPPVLGMLALLGRKSVEVGQRPLVAVVTMGDELVDPGENPGIGQVPDANGPAITGALRALGVRRVAHVRLKDDPTALLEAMTVGLGDCDLLVTVGGASIGDHDHVPQARAELGIRELYRRLAIKPGMPNWFGLGPGDVPVFGLPGNPVSALVSFHQLVKPAVLEMMGAPQRPRPSLPVRVGQAATHVPGRLNWLRGRLVPTAEGGLGAALDQSQGSHMLSALARADILVEIPADSDGAAAGDTLLARRLEWFT